MAGHHGVVSVWGDVLMVKKTRLFRRSNPADPKSWPDYSAHEEKSEGGKTLDLTRNTTPPENRNLYGCAAQQCVEG